jgi:phosphatidylglycerophosphatase C
MTRKDDRSRSLRLAISHILFEEWDPLEIGDLAPRDEYDSYVGGVFRLVASGAPPARVAEHLAEIERSAMGLGDASADANLCVAEKLCSLGVSDRTENRVTQSTHTVIFDLDRTLISCDSFAGCLNGLLLRDWWRVAGVLVASPLLLPLWATETTRPLALWGLLWSATVGLKREEFATLLSRHGEWLASEAESVVHRDGLRALKAHQQSGDRVVMVTGSSGDLARAFCAALGLEDVRVVGSTFRARAGGWVLEDHCTGAHKVALLAAAEVTPPWAIVYTDSASDLPLLRLAARRCVVNPRPQSLRVLNRALGEGQFEILRWN